MTQAELYALLDDMDVRAPFEIHGRAFKDPTSAQWVAEMKLTYLHVDAVQSEVIQSIWRANGLQWTSTPSSDAGHEDLVSTTRYYAPSSDGLVPFEARMVAVQGALTQVPVWVMRAHLGEAPPSGRG